MSARLTLTLQKLGSALRESEPLCPQRELSDRLRELVEQLVRLDGQRADRQPSSTTAAVSEADHPLTPLLG
jgi:hypothetical protein